MGRNLDIKFKTFVSEEIAKKYNGKERDNYPRNLRFNAFIDRRRPNGKDNKDELIFFEPPNNANNIAHKLRSSMIYFDKSRTVLIPSKDYDEGKNDDDDKKKNENQDQQQKLLAQTITSQSKCNGAVMGLSFHVEESNEIRVYLCLNGQIIRFQPNDIIKVLPIFFEKIHGDNEKFPTSIKAKRLVNEMITSLKDARFYAFLDKYQPESLPKRYNIDAKEDNAQ